MAAMAGILNHPLTAGQALTGNGANPMASSTAGTAAAGGTTSTGSSGSSSATISANDFLTLLVTEMQNQDPTAQTDPNEYINQLVQVNSLEQLIDINQNLSTALGTPGGTSTGSTSATQAATAKASVTGASPAGATTPAAATAHRAGALTATPGASSTKPGASTAAAISQFAQSASAKHAPGNLSVPAAQPAAHRVAHALDGHSRAPGIPGKLPVSQ